MGIAAGRATLRWPLQRILARGNSHETQVNQRPLSQSLSQPIPRSRPFTPGWDAGLHTHGMAEREQVEPGAKLTTCSTLGTRALWRFCPPS